jgi:hypothetical protein
MRAAGSGSSGSVISVRRDDTCKMRLERALIQLKATPAGMSDRISVEVIMLTISLDRLFEVLDKASEVELAELAQTVTSGIDSVDDLDRILIDDPAYREMTALLDSLGPDEIYELLALGFLARHAASLDEWQAMVEQARAVPDAAVYDELLRMLLLTDEIELALERLGYGGDDDDDEVEEDIEEE